MISPLLNRAGRGALRAVRNEHRAHSVLLDVADCCWRRRRSSAAVRWPLPGRRGARAVVGGRRVPPPEHAQAGGRACDLEEASPSQRRRREKGGWRHPLEGLARLRHIERVRRDLLRPRRIGARPCACRDDARPARLSARRARTRRPRSRPRDSVHVERVHGDHGRARATQCTSSAYGNAATTASPMKSGESEATNGRSASGTASSAMVRRAS